MPIFSWHLFLRPLCPQSANLSPARPLANQSFATAQESIRIPALNHFSFHKSIDQIQHSKFCPLRGSRSLSVMLIAAISPRMLYFLFTIVYFLLNNKLPQNGVA